jgi:hypothetical protein
MGPRVDLDAVANKIAPPFRKSNPCRPAHNRVIMLHCILLPKIFRPFLNFLRNNCLLKTEQLKCRS